VSLEPFDRVRIKEPDMRILSLKDFLALPLHERIGHILRRDIEFLDGQVVVDWRGALEWLRANSNQR
jgi:hypothetical protein